MKKSDRRENNRNIYNKVANSNAPAVYSMQNSLLPSLLSDSER
jgi:hypothetical protein